MWVCVCVYVYTHTLYIEERTLSNPFYKASTTIKPKQEEDITIKVQAIISYGS